VIPMSDRHTRRLVIALLLLASTPKLVRGDDAPYQNVGPAWYPAYEFYDCRGFDNIAAWRNFIGTRSRTGFFREMGPLSTWLYRNVPYMNPAARLHDNGVNLQRFGVPAWGDNWPAFLALNPAADAVVEGLSPEFRSMVSQQRAGGVVYRLTTRADLAAGRRQTWWDSLNPLEIGRKNYGVKNAVRPKALWNYDTLLIANGTAKDFTPVPPDQWKWSKFTWSGWGFCLKKNDPTTLSDLRGVVALDLDSISVRDKFAMRQPFTVPSGAPSRAQLLTHGQLANSVAESAPRIVVSPDRRQVLFSRFTAAQNGRVEAAAIAGQLAGQYVLIPYVIEPAFEAIDPGSTERVRAMMAKVNAEREQADEALLRNKDEDPWWLWTLKLAARGGAKGMGVP